MPWPSPGRTARAPVRRRCATWPPPGGKRPRGHLISLAMDQQHRRRCDEAAGADQPAGIGQAAGPARPPPAQPGARAVIAPLAEAHQRDAAGRQAERRRFLGDEPAEHPGGGRPRLPPGWPRAVQQREPLPAEGRALAGFGRVRGDEPAARHRLRPGRGEVDQVVRIGAVAMHQQDKRIGRAAPCRAVNADCPVPPPCRPLLRNLPGARYGCGAWRNHRDTLSRRARPASCISAMRIRR